MGEPSRDTSLPPKQSVDPVKIRTGHLKFDEQGLIPAVVQDSKTREVLMLAYMNKESLERTLKTRETWFWSRARSKLWHKGETTGNRQRLVELRIDCDSDSLLIMVEPSGPACHTGAWSCFQHRFDDGEGKEPSHGEPSSLDQVLSELHTVVRTREQARPEGSYTAHLFNEGLGKILDKVSEEADETIMAARTADVDAICSEVCDLFYHLIVMLVERKVPLERVRDELIARRKTRS